MVELKKIDLKSQDIKKVQVEKMKLLFPEVFTEGKIDFDKLRLTLGEDIDSSKERYGMSWAGKSGCYRIIQDPSIGTLNPVREESINFDTTQNMYVEGDNLEVLKLLQKSYYEKIKMIYIDPPYNTGKDFVYSDKFGQQLDEYLKITGQVDSSGKKLSTNTDSDGRYHSNWMNMIYPRLFLAKNLLKDNGVILISINEIEFSNLRKIADEVFGEENYVGEFIWMKGKEGGNDNVGIGIHHEFILVYAKNFIRVDEAVNLDKKDTSRHITSLPEINLVAGVESEYKRGELFQLINLSKQKDYRVKIPLTNGEIIEWDSYCPQKTIDAYIKIGKIFVGQKKVPYVKSFLTEEKQGQKPSSLIESEFGTTKAGSIEIRELFGSREVFSYPKSSKLIKRLCSIFSKEDDVVLDFFAGSGTTAHAVLELNREDGGNRKFICVQLPELTDEDSEAFKAGYKKISDISKERIRRVIKKLSEESNQKTLGLEFSENENVSKQDLGFKVFKLDRSNFKIWDSKAQDVQTALSEHVEQIKSSANPEDLLYEILLKDGFELTLPVKKVKLADKEVYSIEDNQLLICLEDNLTPEVFKELKKLNPYRVVVLDKGFNNNDQLKTNAVQTLGKNNSEEFILRSI